MSSLKEKGSMLAQAGEKLKELRISRGESVHKVAKVVHISGNYLSELERGLKEPSDVVLESIAKHYEADMAYLFSLYSRIAPVETNALLRTPSFRKIVTQMSIDERFSDEEREQIGKELHKLYENLTKGKQK